MVRFFLIRCERGLYVRILFDFAANGNRARRRARPALAMWSANAAFGRVVEGSQLQGRTFLVTEPDGRRRDAIERAVQALGGAICSAAPSAATLEICASRENCVLEGGEQVTPDWLVFQMRVSQPLAPGLSPLFRPLGGTPGRGCEGGIPALRAVAVSLAGFADGSLAKAH